MDLKMNDPCVLVIGGRIIAFSSRLALRIRGLERANGMPKARAVHRSKHAYEMSPHQKLLD